MNLILQALNNRDPLESVWHGRNGWLNVGQILSKVSWFWDACQNQKIALAFSDDEFLAIALIASHQKCEKILLLPSSCDQHQVDEYLIKTDISTLVTDRLDLSAKTVIRITEFKNKTCSNFNSPEFDTAWIIPTSGTTGKPKLISHKFETLSRSVKKNIEKGRCFNWGLVYELSRFAGLQVFLQAILGGSKIVFTEHRNGFEDTFKSLVAGSCNALSATPTWWRRLMMFSELFNLHLQRITMGGEIADQNLINQLTSLFPSARITHIYASTEAGVGFSVADGKAGFPVEWLQSPPSGVELKVDEENMLWLRPNIRGQSCIGSEVAIDEMDGWINTGDLVRYENARFYFVGRANGAINVGGNKVFPEEVEECIRCINGVLQVKVCARPNPLVGFLVEAIVQTEEKINKSELKKTIIQTCRSKLRPYKVPAIINWVDDIKTNSTGKLLRV